MIARGMHHDAPLFIRKPEFYFKGAVCPPKQKCVNSSEVPKGICREVAFLCVPFLPCLSVFHWIFGTLEERGKFTANGFLTPKWIFFLIEDVVDILMENSGGCEHPCFILLSLAFDGRASQYWNSTACSGGIYEGCVEGVVHDLGGWRLDAHLSCIGVWECRLFPALHTVRAPNRSSRCGTDTLACLRGVIYLAGTGYSPVPRPVQQSGSFIGGHCAGFLVNGVNWGSWLATLAKHPFLDWPINP